MILNQTVLKNGLKIITEEVPGSELENIIIVLGFGYRDEGANRKQYTHLLEHLMLNGSRLYPNRALLSPILERTGSVVNGASYYEFLLVNAEFLVEYREQMIEIMCDKITHPLIEQDQIDKEIKVLTNEYHRAMSDDKQYLSRLSMLSLFSGTDMEPVFGETYPLVSVSEKDLKQFFSERLSPNHMTFYAVGGMKHEDVVSAVEKHLGKLSGKSEIAHRPISPQPQIILSPKKAQGTTHLRLNYLLWPATDQRYYALRLINTHLTKGFGSRLYQELRDKRGLTYSIWGEISRFSDVGGYAITLSTKEPTESISILKDEINRLPETITEAKLAELKIQHLSSRKRESLTSQNAMMNRLFGESFSTGQLESNEEYEKKIQSQTLDDIATVLKELTFDKGWLIKMDEK